MQAATDKAVIEMHSLAVILRVHPAIACGRVGFESGQRIDRCSDARHAAVISVPRPGKRAIFRRFRHHVEITQDDVVFRKRQIRNLEFAGTRQATALERKRIDALVQIGELADTLVGRNVIEMNGIDAKRAFRRIDDGLARPTLQIDFRNCAAARQKQSARRQDRPTRKDHVAELEARAARRKALFTGVDMQIAGRAIDPEMVGKEGREIGRHVGKIVSREPSGHLLKPDDIRAIEAVRNTAKIINPIKTEAVLYVIARKLHDNL